MANCQKLVVNGGRRLEGELRVHGAKNSALPLLAACVLAHGECVLHNCPELTDVDGVQDTFLPWVQVYPQRRHGVRGRLQRLRQ